MEVFNNCIKLKSARFYNYGYAETDCNKILTALNETLPKNLKLITFHERYGVNSCVITKYWKGSQPLAIEFDN